MAYKVDVPWPELRPLFRYINEALALKCFSDILEQRLFPDAKEITESMAAYNAIRNKARLFNLGDPNVVLIAVADGNTPRTAAMFAYRTAWQCVSIDPRLVKAGWPIKRLTCWQKRIEDCEPQHFSKLVIVAVHSHAPLDIVCARFTSDERVVVAIPCCVKQERERAPDFAYIDKGIWSPKNKILVWIDRQSDSIELPGQWAAISIGTHLPGYTREWEECYASL